jgi:glutaredoxin 3
MAAQEVVIYTTMFCPYCQRAKAILADKGIAFREIAIDGDRPARQAMTARAGGRTSVPQIFVGDHHVGGCDDLEELEASGKFDALVSDKVQQDAQ